MTMFLGMLGTQDWTDEQDPQSWRETILRIDPNGDSPITAISSLIPSESLQNTVFNWWTKPFEDQRGAVTGRYVHATLSTSYTSGGVDGTVIYFKMSAADASKFRVGYQVLCKDADDPTVDVNGKVIQVTQNGSSSFVAVRLLEDDDNSDNHDLSDCDVLWIIGTINAEGAARPDALYRLPTKIFNNTQIWRDSCEITGTAKVINLRTGNSYEDQKLDALLSHGRTIEKSCIFGIRTTNTGANGKEERTTRGIVDTIRTYASANIKNFQTDTDEDLVGKSWVEAGGKFLNDTWEVLFRYGSEERVAYCGSLALRGIQDYVEARGTFNFTAETAAYGIKIIRWTTPFGEILFKRHPLLTAEPSTRNSMLVLDHGDLVFRPLKNRDTHFRPDPDLKKSGQVGMDGIAEEWLTEGGFEFHFPETCGWINGVGLDNNVAGG